MYASVDVERFNIRLDLPIGPLRFGATCAAMAPDPVRVNAISAQAASTSVLSGWSLQPLKPGRHVRAFAVACVCGACRTLAATPEQLFGGQQRLAMARTLATPTESILFDEPTRTVDPRMAADVIGVITGLATSRQKMIVVTHAMGFARDASHTVTVMPADRVAESGPPEQIFENPREEVTRTFLAMTKAN